MISVRATVVQARAAMMFSHSIGTEENGTLHWVGQARSPRIPAQTSLQFLQHLLLLTLSHLLHLPGTSHDSECLLLRRLLVTMSRGHLLHKNDLKENYSTLSLSLYLSLSQTYLLSIHSILVLILSRLSLLSSAAEEQVHKR